MTIRVQVTCSGCNRKRKYVIGEGGVTVPPCPNCCKRADMEKLNTLIEETRKLTAAIKRPSPLRGKRQITITTWHDCVECKAKKTVAVVTIRRKETTTTEVKRCNKCKYQDFLKAIHDREIR